MLFWTERQERRLSYWSSRVRERWHRGLPALAGLAILPALAAGGCLPTLKIEGEFTVLHQVVHSVDQQGREGREITIRELKVTGLVGERYDGYLGLVVPDVDDEILELMERVNSERRQRYAEMAAQYEGIEQSDIELRAGQALLDREQTGFFIMPGPESGWRRK